MSLWNSYRSVIYGNCTSGPGVKDALHYWRDNLFAVTVLFIIPLSVIGLIPGMYMAWKEELTWLIAADVVLIINLITIAFVPGIPVAIRKLLFCFSLYLVSVTLLFYLGSFGPGLMYLLAVTVFAVLIFPQRIGLYIAILNVVVCFGFGLAIHHEWFETLNAYEYSVGSWIAITSNLILLSFLAVLLIPRIFNGLQRTIDEQVRLQNELGVHQKKLEESLTQLSDKNRELEEFAYAVSHDMKEPLRMIRSFLKLLNDRYNDIIDDRGRKYIFFAVDGATRMSAFIDDLLEYSRVGRMYTEFEEVDLDKILEDLKKIFINELHENNASIIYSSMPMLHAIPINIKMLFQNLISNGLKYQPEGAKPEIRISCEDAGRYWRFKVIDNGIGINMDYSEQIFQLFNRLHSNDVYSGTGMGLAICRKIVQQHGGEISVESQEGKGATFIFTLEKGR